ncbi:CHRD domain-containing protein [Herbaspirillum sp. HC18]|nr:CHRD domain-containing protein [Herbaspirillum sp. HC18]
MRSTLSRLSFIGFVSVGILASLATCGGDGNDNPPAATAPTAPGASSPGAGTTAPLSINVALTGANEVPPNNSKATGAGVFTIDRGTRQFSATVITTGIVGTAAHIHQGVANDSGPVVFPMTQDPAGSGVWKVSGQLTEAQMAVLSAEQFYMNVHSAAFPSGEIRGQIPEQ